MKRVDIEDDSSRLTALIRQVNRLQGIEDVRRLQNIYGYYMDRFLYEEVVSLMAQDVEIRFMGGIYRGTAGAQRLFLENLGKTFAGGRHGPPVHGRLAEHEMIQDVITVDDDATTALARVRHVLKAGWHESVRETVVTGARAGIEMQQWFEGGLYENEYVKQNGTWKFRLLDYQIVYFGSHEHGASFTPENYQPWFTRTFPDDPGGPDELIDPPPVGWPQMVSVPFHYANPVTGRRVEM